MGSSEAEWLHGKSAIQIAKDGGVFSGDESLVWRSQPIEGRKSVRNTEIESWAAAVDRLTNDELNPNDHPT